MARYESDREGFIMALGLATGAAVVMPYAWPIAGLMGLMVSDPHAQDQAAEQWLNPTATNIGPSTDPGNRPPGFIGPVAASTRGEHSGGASDIAYLRSELQRLTREIGTSEDWEGRAYNSFKQKVDVLDGHLATLDQNRVACGNTLSASATGFHVLMTICIIAAGFLAALAAFVLGCRISVAFAAQGEAAAARAVLGLHRSLSTVFKNHWKLVLKASAILGVAGVAYNQFTQDLPGLQAVSTGAKPNLMEASAIYNPATADITTDPKSQIPDPLENPSVIPEIGW